METRLEDPTTTEEEGSAEEDTVTTTGDLETTTIIPLIPEAILSNLSKYRTDTMVTEGLRFPTPGDTQKTESKFRKLNPSISRSSARPSLTDAPSVRINRIMLNYSDSPSVPIPTGPRHASPRSSNQSTLRSEPSRPSSIKAPLSDRSESTAQPPTVEDTTPINLEVAEEPDPEQVLAERRRKRAEILAKYASKQPPSTDTDNSAPATDSTGAGQAANAEKREPEEEKSVSTPGRNEVERATKRLKLGTGQLSRALLALYLCRGFRTDLSQSID